MRPKSSRDQKSTTPRWRQIAHRFTDDRSCLAGFLAMETAEVLAGVKPANLINVVNNSQPCGRNLYQLWEGCGPQLVENSGLAWLILRRRPDALLLLVYRLDALHALLGERRVSAMLERAGYQGQGAPEAVLAELQRRCERDTFPHEIGIFLGYPLKDVAAFLGWAAIPFACQGPWKIYGDPSPSLKLAERHRACRCRMAWKVAACDDPQACLRLVG